MSYAMTHLIIANEFMKDKEIANQNLFLLGSLSPDAVHSREDFTFRLKADAHDLQAEEKWGQIATEEPMKIWYERQKEFYLERSRLARNEDELSFLQGYTHHMLVDIFNCKLLYAKHLIRYDYQVDLMRDQYRKECILQDNYLYQNYEGIKELHELMIETCETVMNDELLENLQLTQFISTKNIRATLAYQKNGYLNAETAYLDGLEMVSKESSEAFLEIVCEETKRMLWEYPEAKRSFEVCM